MATTVTSSVPQLEEQHNYDKREELTDKLAAISITKTSIETSKSTTANTVSSSVVYDVEHLATFSTNGNNETSTIPTTTGTTANINNRSQASTTNDGDGNACGDDDDCGVVSANGSGGKNKICRDLLGDSSQQKGQNLTVKTTPKVALQRLFELERLSGIWTQHMQIELLDDYMLIVDCETNSVVEKFNKDCVTRPEAFNQYNDIYNNIIVFIIQQRREQENIVNAEQGDLCDRTEQNISVNDSEKDPEDGELHIFQCVSHEAQKLVSDILAWKSHKSSSPICDSDQKMANLFSNNDVSKTTKEQQQQRKHHQQQQENHKKSSTAKDQDLAPDSSDSNCSDQAQACITKKSPDSPPSNNNNKPVVTVASSAKSTGESVPLVNVNVKETVQVFNQIAALREKGKPTSPINNQSARPLSNASVMSSQSNSANFQQQQQQQQQQKQQSTTSEPDSLISASTTQQLYKQRSIRATLAPKYTPTSADQDVGSSSSHLTQSQLNSSTNSGSSASSSMVAEQHLQSQPQQHLPPHHHHHKSGLNKLTNGMSSEGSNSAQLLQSSIANPPSTVGHHQHHHHHHHKSSSSKSRTTVDQSFQQQQRLTQSESSRSQASSSSIHSQIDQVTTNESYVSVLNHCFDDIEKFIIRLQQAVTGQAALRELQAGAKRGNKMSKKMVGGGAPISNSHLLNPQAGGVPIGNRTTTTNLQALPTSSSNNISSSELAMLTAQARGPSEDDYFEILSKFKLAFNLLAKLKGCIHEPNAPELVHFLFTPLAIIIDSARNATPPIDPTLVGIPYLNQDALDLLSNCCTSKESDMWISLGPNWTQTIDINLLKASRLPSSFQPIFSDGWAPIVGELELIGLVAPPGQQLKQPSATHSSNDDGFAQPSTLATGSADHIHQNHNADDTHNHHRHPNHHNRTTRANHYHHNSTEGYNVPADAYSAASNPVTLLQPIDPHSAYPTNVAVSGGAAGRSSGAKAMGSRKKTTSSQAFGSAGDITGRGVVSRNYPMDQSTIDQLEPAAARAIEPLDAHHHMVSTARNLPYNSQMPPYGYLLDAQSHSNNNIHGNPYDGRARRPAKGSGPYGLVSDTGMLDYDDNSNQYPTISMKGGGAQYTEDDDEDLTMSHQDSSHRSDHHYQRQHGFSDPEMLQSGDPYDPYLDGMVNPVDEHPQSRMAPGTRSNHHHHHRRHHHGSSSNMQQAAYQGRSDNSYHSGGGGGGAPHPTRVGGRSYTSSTSRTHHIGAPPLPPDEYLLSDAEHEALLNDLGPVQAEWFYELQARGALIVRVLFNRAANNDKELTVHRGELLEVLDDTRKWWRARNIELQVAHVPHTIVAVMQGYQTLDELLANQVAVEHDESSLMTSSSSANMFSRRDIAAANALNRGAGHHHQLPAGTNLQAPTAMQLNGNFNNNQHLRTDKEAKRINTNNSKTAGAFRYF